MRRLTPGRSIAAGIVVVALLGASPGLSTATSSPRVAADEFGWAVIDSRQASTMSSTDRDDWEQIQGLVESGGAPMFWFRFDDRSWIVHDPSIVARAQEITAPIRELGRRKSELAREKIAVIDRMAESGARRAELKARKVELSRRKSEIGREKAQASRDLEPEIRELAERAIRDGRAEPLSR